MPFSAAVVSELQGEVKRLERDRAVIDARLDALRKILGEEQMSDGGTWGSVFSVGVSPSGRASQSASPIPGPDARSFRDEVLAVIRQHPGVKAAFVARALREHGVAPGGNTPLSHRVYNEVWRMTNNGVLRKNDDGGFTVVAQEEG